MFCDSQSAIALSKHNSFHSRTKHIDVRYHLIRDHLSKGTFELTYKNTKEMIADIFTKPLPRDQFKLLRDTMLTPIIDLPVSQAHAIWTLNPTLALTNQEGETKEHDYYMPNSADQVSHIPANLINQPKSIREGDLQYDTDLMQLRHVSNSVRKSVRNDCPAESICMMEHSIAGEHSSDEHSSDNMCTRAR